MSTVISSFRGKYGFLSNFWPCYVTLDSVEYPSVEHAYQAAKTLDGEQRKLVLHKYPAEAKRLGRKFTLRPGWDNMKLDVMLDLLKQKFSYPDLRSLLLETNGMTLIEGNNWGDTFWGVCNGVGSNNLGKLLMRVRDEVQ